MRRHARRRDQNRKTAPPRRTGKRCCLFGTTVSGQNAHFEWDAVFLQYGNGLFHDGQITGAAHDDSDFFHAHLPVSTRRGQRGTGPENLCGSYHTKQKEALSMRKGPAERKIHVLTGMDAGETARIVQS